jgi:single-stranded-DNA-specific exonuclease
MKGINTAAALIADAVMAKARIVVVGDYDCDGATATALAVRALSAMGGDVAYLIPNRFTDGYGLSPRIVELAAERFAPQLLITVDNGIASHSGVAAAHQRNIRVVITDHHLPGETLPAADALVNPNQPDCPFPSKAIAGVGVLFYVMMAVRAELRRRGWFTKERPEPNLAQWLDLVALGTVADVVPLDHNNRILVAQGLARIRAGRASPGLIALFQAARRDPRFANSQDLGFFIAPRLNAAGRLQAMTLGVACLLADSLANALPLAQQLDAINRERQAIETRMRDEALVLTDGMAIGEQQTLVLFHPGWHQGVIGLVASRLKERYGRPVFAFAPHEDGLIKGSGRSVTGLHLRDALDLVSKWEPTLLIAFGGHAMAAGVMLREADLPRFTALFEEAVARLAPDGLNPNILETDGSLPLSEATLSTAERLQDVVWGQGFPAPLFLDTFALLEQRLVGGGHLQLRLCRNDGDRQAAFAAIRFRQTEPFPPSFTGAYQLTIDRYQGEPRLRLLLEGIAPAISGDAINLG